MEREQKIRVANEALGAIVPYIFDRSVVITAHNGKEPIDHGTGMLLRVGDTPLVITAAHVIMRHDLQYLQIGGTYEASNVRVEPSGKEFIGGEKEDELDVGFLSLTEESAAVLKSKKFLELNDLEPFPTNLSNDLVLIFGMPEALHHVDREIVHCYKSLSYIANQPADVDWTQLAKFPSSIMLEYPEEVNDSITREWVTLPNPHGMSGGGVWVARFKDSLVWIPETLRLIGINSEWFQTDMKVRANRIEPLLELLARHFPEAEKYLETKRENIKKI